MIAPSPMSWMPSDLTTVRLSDGSDGFKRSWIMLLPEGKFEHPKFGELDLSRKTLTEMVTNFKANARGIEIALDYDHKASEGDSRAPGWLEDMQVRPAQGETPAGLWGLVRWTPLGLKDIKDQVYRYVSAEFKEDYRDDVSGEKYKNVIIGATLTNRPFMKQMPAVKLKDYSHAERDAMDESDFAGPHQSFPIKTQQDVHNAARLIGHADDPAAVKAAIIRIAKRKGFSLPDSWQEDSSDSGSTAASETEMPMATRTARKLADEALPADDDGEEQEEEDTDEVTTPAEDEVEDADTADEEEGEEESEDSSESSDGDDGEDDDGEESETEFSTLSEMMAHITGVKKLAAPMAAKGKGKKKAAPPADDEEDAQDNGDDEDQEAESYDESSVHIPGEMKIVKKMAKAPAAKKMSEAVQLREENARLSTQLAEAQAEITTLREAAWKTTVSTRLAEMTKLIRTESQEEAFALPRSFKKLYESFMLEEGIKLSEGTLDRFHGLVAKALAVGTVPLTSLANQIEEKKVLSLDDRRPRISSKDPGEASRLLSEEIKALALADGKEYDSLSYDDRLAYRRLALSRGVHGEPVA